MSYFNIVAQTNENTVVTEYEPVKKRSVEYQSEAALEKEFIRMLTEQGYEYLPIHAEEDLIANLRNKLETLNSYKFSDDEWKRFFAESVANPNDHIVEKTRKIQEDFVQVLKRDDGTSLNITLIDKKNIHNNSLQVINQYVLGKEEGASYDNRYDVTILVNGLPLVHTELKRRGVPLKEAFNQIERYQRDSFWAGCGLYEYIQIFVISNGTNTKYYSNTTRMNVEEGYRNMAKAKQTKTSNSFEFTSFWADASNRIIPDLIDFTRTFFAKHTLLNILTKYCVFTAEKMLLVMRPYQITATERILNRIQIAENYKKFGSIEGGGYIWHTTGSGKTLTSFKTARLASQLPFVDKVLFVVDRKDLDYQTMAEYDRFEKGAANSNTSTTILTRQLSDPNVHIIITTIQKLSIFIKKNKTHPVYNNRVVLIFDECHRSQFGEMHAAVVKSFKRYNLFGFTGTPIFAVNSGSHKHPEFMTTAQTFGDQLHTYTIVDAINDGNVLPFKVDYIKTMESEESIDDEMVWDIDREKAYMSPTRIKLVTKYILDRFDVKTARDQHSYEFRSLKNITEIAEGKQGKVKEVKEKRNIKGFNSILAVASIPMAKMYYTEFKKQMDEPGKKYRVALIYSFGANEDEQDGIIDDENSEDTSELDANSRDFLEAAIQDYNLMFHTNYDTSSDKFQNYYRDVSLRMKNREIDLLIVVNMFLTGFDATTLNTLWVDKNLRAHGLIQAFSRTNRILNSVKRFGNIVCFRNLQKRVDSAISLFGDKNAGGIVLMRSFNDYYRGFTNENQEHVDGYADLIMNLYKNFPLTEPRIIGEKNQKEFIGLFGAILRMRNILIAFDEFEGMEILSEYEMQDYLGRYQDLREEWKRKRDGEEATDITDDIVFETELIKQIEINIDYILLLVKKYHDSHLDDKEVLVKINRAIDSSPELRSKKDLINNFIAGINEVDDVMDAWQEYIANEKEKALALIIEEEKLKDHETREFVENAFREGELATDGTAIDVILPPMSRFGGKGSRFEKKRTVTERLLEYFRRFFGIGASRKDGEG